MAFMVHHHIPAFLSDQIVYCDQLILGRNRQLCLLLARSLKFYEFSCKQLIHVVDLSHSCLHKVQPQLNGFEGPKGKWLEGVTAAQAETASVNTETKFPSEAGSITFAKFIYRNFEICKLYVLLRCWDKLVVLQRWTTAENDAPDYRIAAEYEDVECLGIVHGKLKYQAALEIRFKNGTIITTDLQPAAGGPAKDVNTVSSIAPQNHLQQTLLERVRSAKAELQLHKVTTQKHFERLRNMQTFGSNLLRSLKLEEKQLLTRCGDIWLRFTPSNALVLGVPLVNSGAPPNLNVLQRIRPLLQPLKATSQQLEYKYCLYQLRQQHENLESIETFFQCADTEIVQEMLNGWGESARQKLLPGAFGVLLIELNICAIITLAECALLVCFEASRHDDDDKRQERRYDQQLFLKQWNFAQLLSTRKAFEISFQASTLHQDFLAMAMTSKETRLQLSFKTPQDAEIFERLLCLKLEFSMVTRATVSCEESDEPINACTCVYYNKSAASMWFGTLALRMGNVAGSGGAPSAWKFYTKNQEQAFLLLKLLFSELILTQCNLDIAQANTRNELQLVKLKQALTEELLTLQACSKGKEEENQQLLCKLWEKQASTDLLIAHMEGCI